MLTPGALRDRCLELVGAEETFPFNAETSVFKVGGKIFALAALDEQPLTVSLKIDPALSELLRAAHESVVPGYHLNKRHWVTVTVGGDLEDAQVLDLVEDSYDLVRPKRCAARGDAGSS